MLPGLRVLRIPWRSVNRPRWTRVEQSTLTIFKKNINAGFAWQRVPYGYVQKRHCKNGPRTWIIKP